MDLLTKKTTLYEEHFYKIPSGEINYEFGALTCFGDVTLYDNRITRLVIT